MAAPAVSSDGHALFAQAVSTVESVDAQFQELKRTADDLLAWIDGLDRDYLKPKEDEATRRLLITYWQLRLALLETFEELRARGRQRPADYEQLFLPGYAGALVLLDGARYLRDRFHQRKLIRRKLNEPEPAFGIPAGAYDATQHSWTRPGNYWSLFDAAQYYQRRRRLWDAAPDREAAARLCALIDRLSRQLRLQWADFAEARIRVRLRQVWNLLRRDLFANAMFQMQKAAGVLASDRYLKLGHAPALPDAIRTEFNRLLRPGDVLLCRKEYAVTNYFLPGYWPHVALYVGDVGACQAAGVDRLPQVAPHWERFLACDAPDRGRVIEAMKDGVRIRSLASPYSSDSVAVLRPQLSPAAIAEGLARAFLHEGKEYDFNFDFSTSDRLVCTEVVYRAFDGLEDLTFPLTPRAGRMTLAAADITAMALRGERFDVVAAYVPAVATRLVEQEAARAAVRRAFQGAPADA